MFKTATAEYILQDKIEIKFRVLKRRKEDMPHKLNLFFRKSLRDKMYTFRKLTLRVQLCVFFVHNEFLHLFTIINLIERFKDTEKILCQAKEFLIKIISSMRT